MDLNLRITYRPPVAGGPASAGLQVARLRIRGRSPPLADTVLAPQLLGPLVGAPHAGHPPALGAPSTAG